MFNIARYDRQIVLEQIGEEGQRKLLAAKVTVIGLGALGTVSSTLLARGGVGRLTLIDRDVVELVNLQRQVLYDEEDIGLPKALRAADKLRSANSSMRVEGVAKDLSFANVKELLADSDIVVDGTDNLETRFLVNETCIEMKKPWVYGGAIETEGRVMAIVPGKTACFRCFNRSIPAPGTIPTCETVGILNSVAAATASLQVTEVIKVLLGNEPTGHLLVLDGWTPEVMRIKIERSANCPACVAGKKEYASGKKPQVITAMCGQNMISFDPLYKGDIDLPSLGRRLGKIGDVKVSQSVVFFKTGEYELTIFQDGRALIKGTNSAEVARSLYSKYVGL